MCVLCLRLLASSQRGGSLLGLTAREHRHSSSVVTSSVTPPPPTPPHPRLQLLWAFFEYWAYRHDWAHGVVSIRLGGLLSKEDKGWTRRVGSERHLVCVEDPFETRWADGGGVG